MRRLALVLLVAAAAAAQDALPGAERSTPDGALLRLGRPWLHDPKGFRAVAISKNGALVAGLSEESLHVWNARTGSHALSVAAGTATSLAFSPDGKTIAASGESGASFFDLKTAEEKEPVEGARGPIVWSPDGREVALQAGPDVTVFSWPSLAKERSFSQAVNARAFVFAPRGLAILDEEGSVALARVQTGERLHYWDSRGMPAAIDSTATLLAHTNRDGEILLFDMGAGKHVVSLEGHQDRRVTALVFAPNERLLASGDDRGTVKVWFTDGDTALPLTTIQAHASAISGIAFNGSALATIAEGDPELKLFSARTGAAARTGHAGPVTALAYSPDGKRLASAGTDGTVLVWSAWDRTLASTLHVKGAASLAFSPDSRLLAIGLKDGSTHLLDAGSGRELWNAPTTESDAALSLAFMPRGDRLVTGMLHGTLIVRDVSTGKETTRFAGADGAARSIAVSNDGKLVAATNGFLAPASTTVNVFDVASGRMRRLPHQDEVASLSFGPDGKTLLACGTEGLHLWDASLARTRIRSIELEGASRAAISPDGKLVAAVVKGKVELRLLATGDLVFTGDGHRGAVGALAFAPSSQELASAGEDGSIVIWNTQGVKK